MSSNKRRKIEKKDDSDLLQNFKEGLVMLFNGRQAVLSFKQYCKLWLKQRVRASSKELNTRWMKRAYRGRESELKKYGSGVNLLTYENEWNKMKGKERLKELKKFVQHEEFFLRDLLKRLGVIALRKFVLLFVDDSEAKKFKTLSKVHVIQELLNRFFERTGDIEKRVMEEENLLEFDEDELESREFQFLTLCGIQLPVDILHHVLGFLRYDSSMLFEVGRISKVFYINILSTWPRIKIRKKNVFKISLLVIRSVREVTFDVPPDSPSETFLNKELDHVIKNLNPNRLQIVNIESRVYSYGRIMRYFSKNAKNVFRNVRVLRHVSDPWIRKDCRKKDITEYKKLSSIANFSSVFPILNEFVYPLDFTLLSGMSRLRILSVNLCACYRYDTLAGMWSWRRKDPGKISDTLGLLTSEKRDKHIPKEQIERLRVIIHPSDSVRMKLLPSFLKSGFTNLEALKLTLNAEFRTTGGGPQFLNFVDCFSSLPQLAQLDLSVERRGYGPTGPPIITLPASLDLPFLTNLKVFRYRDLPLCSLKGIISCLCHPRLEVLDVRCRYRKDEDSKLHALFMEKLNKKLFSYHNFSITIDFHFLFEGHMFNYLNIRRETEIAGTLSLSLKNSLKKDSMYRCILEAVASKSYSHFLPKSRGGTKPKILSDFPLLHALLTQFPQIVGKMENRERLANVTFKDVSAHVFCKFDRKWMKKMNEDYYSNDTTHWRSWSSWPYKEEKDDDGEGSEEEIENWKVSENTTTFFDLFKEKMEEEGFNFEQEDLGFERVRGAWEKGNFT